MRTARLNGNGRLSDAEGRRYGRRRSGNSMSGILGRPFLGQAAQPSILRRFAQIATKPAAAMRLQPRVLRGSVTRDITITSVVFPVAEADSVYMVSSRLGEDGKIQLMQFHPDQTATWKQVPIQEFMTGWRVSLYPYDVLTRVPSPKANLGQPRSDEDFSVQVNSEKIRLALHTIASVLPTDETKPVDVAAARSAIGGASAVLADALDSLSIGYDTFQVGRFSYATVANVISEVAQGIYQLDRVIQKSGTPEGRMLLNKVVASWYLYVHYWTAYLFRADLWERSTAIKTTYQAAQTHRFVVEEILPAMTQSLKDPSIVGAAGEEAGYLRGMLEEYSRQTMAISSSIDNYITELESRSGVQPSVLAYLDDLFEKSFKENEQLIAELKGRLPGGVTLSGLGTNGGTKPGEKPGEKLPERPGIPEPGAPDIALPGEPLKIPPSAFEIPSRPPEEPVLHAKPEVEIPKEAPKGPVEAQAAAELPRDYAVPPEQERLVAEIKKIAAEQKLLAESGTVPNRQRYIEIGRQLTRDVLVQLNKYYENIRIVVEKASRRSDFMTIDQWESRLREAKTRKDVVEIRRLNDMAVNGTIAVLRDARTFEAKMREIERLAEVEDTVLAGLQEALSVYITFPKGLPSSGIPAINSVLAKSDPIAMMNVLLDVQRYYNISWTTIGDFYRAQMKNVRGETGGERSVEAILTTEIPFRIAKYRDRIAALEGKADPAAQAERKRLEAKIDDVNFFRAGVEASRGGQGLNAQRSRIDAIAGDLKTAFAQLRDMAVGSQTPGLKFLESLQAGFKELDATARLYDMNDPVVSADFKKLKEYAESDRGRREFGTDYAKKIISEFEEALKAVQVVRPRLKELVDANLTVGDQADRFLRAVTVSAQNLDTIPAGLKAAQDLNQVVSRAQTAKGAVEGYRFKWYSWSRVKWYFQKGFWYGPLLAFSGPKLLLEKIGTTNRFLFWMAAIVGTGAGYSILNLIRRYVPLLGDLIDKVFGPVMDVINAFFAKLFGVVWDPKPNQPPGQAGVPNGAAGGIQWYHVAGLALAIGVVVQPKLVGDLVTGVIDVIKGGMSLVRDAFAGKKAVKGKPGARPAGAAGPGRPPGPAGIQKAVEEYKEARARGDEAGMERAAEKLKRAGVLPEGA